MNRALWINEHAAGAEYECAAFYARVVITRWTRLLGRKRRGACQGCPPLSTCGSWRHALYSPRVEIGARRGAPGEAHPAKRRPARPNYGPYAVASSSTSAVACAMNAVISSTARRASGLMSKLSWNMCIALSHT